MNFNAKDDFVTEQEIREEQEQLAEDKIADEEDNGYDYASLKRESPDMTFWEEQAFENERQDGEDEDEL